MRTFRVLVFQTSQAYWIGVCLEVDYAAQGNSREHAVAYTIEGTAILIQENSPGSRDNMTAPDCYVREYEAAGSSSEERRKGRVAGEDCEFIVRNARESWQPSKAA